MDSLLKELGIDETYTKSVRKQKHFTRFKDVLPPIKGLNYCSDLLMLPSDQGYRYLNVIVDMADSSIDFEPQKNKSASATLKATLEIFKRRPKYLSAPKATIRVDDGNEYKGVYRNHFFNKNIAVKAAIPNRHTQNAVCESANKQLSRILQGLMNKQEEATGQTSRVWVKFLPQIRTGLNKIRRKLKLPKDIYRIDFPPINLKKPAKFKVGDLVYRLSDWPLDALDKQQPTARFRAGDVRWDRQPRKVVRLFHYSGPIAYRYLLSDLPNVSFTEKQIMIAPEKEHLGEAETTVKKILRLATDEDGDEFYLVWFKKNLKKDAIWIPKDRLIEDVPQMVKEFDRKSEVRT